MRDFAFGMLIILIGLLATFIVYWISDNAEFALLFISIAAAYAIYTHAIKL